MQEYNQKKARCILVTFVKKFIKVFHRYAVYRYFYRNFRVINQILLIMTKEMQEKLAEHEMKMKMIKECDSALTELLKVMHPEARAFLIGLMLMGRIWFFISQFK